MPGPIATEKIKQKCFDFFDDAGSFAQYLNLKAVWRELGPDLGIDIGYVAFTKYFNEWKRDRFKDEDVA